MPLSAVTINVGQGGIGRRPLNQDKISGILYYNDTLPSGFSASERVKKIFSLEEAEGLGIAEGSADHDVEHYHISEYFRLNPEGELWVGYFDVPATTYDFTELETMQTEASGEIRQIALYAPLLAYATTQLTTIDGVLDGLAANGIPCSVFYAADFSGVVAITGWSTVGDARAEEAARVTPVVGQDGGAAGKALFDAKGYSITCLGAVLGAVSSAAVNTSIGFVAQFNASNGVELEVPALANGDLVKDLTDTALGGIKDDGYQIIIKRTPKVSGTYFERTPTADLSTSDFAWNELVRTVDKATRLVDSALTPQLNSGVVLNDDGTISDESINYLVDIADLPLDQMLADGEISAKEVLIDPNQDVAATSTVVVTIKVVPTGTAEFITVNIGLTNSL